MILDIVASFAYEFFGVKYHKNLNLVEIWILVALS